MVVGVVVVVVVVVVVAVVVIVVVVAVEVVAVDDVGVFNVYFSKGEDSVLIVVVIYLSPKDVNTDFYIKSAGELKLLVVEVPG